MGLKEMLFGKKNPGNAESKGNVVGTGNAGCAGNAVNAGNSGAPGAGEFSYGVEDVFRLNDSPDRIVVGHVYGRINKGDAIYISNPGEDHAEVVLGIASDLLINTTNVATAENTTVSIRVENGSNCLLKTGTVIHSRGASVGDVHNAYINALGEGYISFKRMELKQEEYDRMSVTDIVELFRLYLGYCKENANDPSNKITARQKEISNTFANLICSKVLASKEIYVLMSKRTGEAAMMSHTYQAENGSYVTAPPDLLIVTRAYADVWKRNYDPSKYDFLEVLNGPDGNGIYNFLGNAFYVNGACGVRVIYENMSIGAQMFVPPPEYKDVPEIQIPVTNPDLERWLLLIGQLTPPADEKENNLLSILYSHLFRELGNAKFLVPMKFDSDPGEADSEGKITLKKDTRMSLATRPGKNGRSSVMMYTDWKKLRMYYKEEDGWSGMIQTIAEVIETFDCAINVTDHREAGVYIDKQTYETNILKK